MEIEKKLIKANYTPRNARKIKGLVVHHTASITTKEALFDWFNKPTTRASTHYGIDKNGQVIQMIEDKNEGWSTGDTIGNQNTISIEVSNEKMAPYWTVSEKNIDILVELLYELAKKHDLLPLKLGKNFFGHRDIYKGTTCPGDFLYNRLPEIEKRVNNYNKKKNNLNCKYYNCINCNCNNCNII